MQRYFLKLSYNGTEFNGWQIQPNGRTVQGEINDTLTKLNRNVVVGCMGCGRTDTGVHATKFYAHFDFPLIKNISQFIYKMNNMLPNDIVIHDLILVKEDAHTRFDATSRTYNYYISSNKSAFNHELSLLLNQDLNIDKMNLACKTLLSHTDFEAFSKVKTEVKTFDCNITHAEWKKTEEGYVFIISANRFLRNMVRAIVGTMIEIGLEKWSVSELENIIISKSRSEAGKSVASNGLFLTDVNYPYL